MFILFFKLHVAVKRISQKPLSRLQLDSTSPPHTEETEGRRENETKVLHDREEDNNIF